MKRLWTIISIVISLFFLIYMIIEYYGLLRHARLKYVSINNLLLKYKNIPKFTKDRIVVLFHGIINNRFLSSVLDQTTRIDEIVLGGNNKSEKIRGELEKIFSRAKTESFQETLKHVILTETEKNTRIIVLNSAFSYGKHLIEDLIDMSDENPNDLICINSDSEQGFLLKPDMGRELLTRSFSDTKKLLHFLSKKCISIESNNFRA